MTCRHCHLSALQDLLLDLGACEEARAWAGDRDPRTAWAECERGDWLLWLAGRAGIDRRTLVQAACDCAELAWPHARGTDTLLTCMLAVHVTREWCDGRADLDDVRAVAAAAAAAAAHTDALADAAAGYAAAHAAYAAYNAAYAAHAAHSAYDAADAAYAAAHAGYAAAWDASRVAVLRKAADLVRARISVELIEQAIGAKRGAA